MPLKSPILLTKSNKIKINTIEQQDALFLLFSSIYNFKQLNQELQEQQIIQLMNLVKKANIFKLSFQHNYTQLNRIKEVLEKNVFK